MVTNLRCDGCVRGVKTKAIEESCSEEVGKDSGGEEDERGWDFMRIMICAVM